CGLRKYYYSGGSSRRASPLLTKAIELSLFSYFCPSCFSLHRHLRLVCFIVLPSLSFQFSFGSRIGCLPSTFIAAKSGPQPPLQSTHQPSSSSPRYIYLFHLSAGALNFTRFWAGFQSL
ncbi:hypothetical protein AFLA70_287g001231, partial [Aspergillus flavus AF70]